MSVYILLLFLFLHASLLVPGYALVRSTRLLNRYPGIELSFGYLVTLAFLFTLSILGYALEVNTILLQIIGWAGILAGAGLFIIKRYWNNVWKLRFPLICLVLTSLLTSVFVSLSYSGQYTFLPDPTHQAGRNYDTLNVKILNLAHTQANDNYIPYRQAQFFSNSSDPVNDSFIGEWGVHFFQRTPLMGAVSSSYFILLDDNLPTDYTWSATGKDPDQTYQKFQIMAHIMNSLFIVPGFFLLIKLFNRKTAIITTLFLVPSQFFLYNSFFSWPKSLVAFFILLSWLLLLQKRMRLTIPAAIAGGLAYLSHDLALLYIGSAVLFLLWNRRYREMLIYGALSSAFAIPWIFISAVIFDKPSSFVLYPISLKGIPSPQDKEIIIYEFLHTSPLHIIWIKINNLLYLISPYQLLTSEGGQSAWRRLWSLGIYSIPGAVGLGLFIPTLLGAVKRMQSFGFWILSLSPVVLAVLSSGWPRALGALHFAEPIIVPLSGLGVAWLATLKRGYWMLIAFLVNVAQMYYLVAFSFDFRIGQWLTSFTDIIGVLVLIAIPVSCGWLILLALRNHKNWIIS